MSSSLRRFAANAFSVFVTGAVAIMLFEIAERNDLISNLTESVARFAVWSLLVVLLLASAGPLSAAARSALRICVFGLLVDFGLDVIEDIDRLNQLPLIGGGSRWRHTVEKGAVSVWGCGAFYLLYVLMRDLDSSFSELKKQDAEKAQLNQQLRRTISDLKEAQAQVVQQERLSALGQMATGVAHDLNNALTPVVAFSDLLTNHPDSYNENLSALEAIQDGASHAAEVVKQLQDFCRGDSVGSVDRMVQRVNLTDVVKQAKDLSRFRWRDEAMKRGAHFDIQVNVCAGGMVMGNRTELVQLVTNLLLNAVEAMKAGGAIKVSTARQDGFIKLTVADQGVGMSAGERARCFEPFYTNKLSGTGLGLSVCHGIVRRHGGSIQCDANVSGGCDFTVWLPESDENEGSKRDQDEDPMSCRGKRVLVIDDDESVLRSVSALLQFLGSTSDTALEAEHGIALAKENEYDLVITDLGMPGVSGRDVVSEIKGLRPSQPIAVASGWSGDAARDEFRNAPAVPDFYIDKPINSSKLGRVFHGVACKQAS